MSALAERPMDHASVRARLGMPMHSTPRMLIHRDPFVPPPPSALDRMKAALQHIGDAAQETPAGKHALFQAPLAYAPKPPRRYITAHQVEAEVSAKHGVSKALMRGRLRFKRIVAARNEAMYRMREEVLIQGKPMSLPAIGRYFYRDHSTVCHGIRMHKKAMAEAEEAASNIKLSLCTLTLDAHKRTYQRSKEGCATRPNAAMVDA